MIFNSFYFQSSLHKSIQTVTKNLDRIDYSTLVGMTTMTSPPDPLILERKIEELYMYRISFHLRIDGLE